MKDETKVGASLAEVKETVKRSDEMMWASLGSISSRSFCKSFVTSNFGWNAPRGPCALALLANECVLKRNYSKSTDASATLPVTM